MRRFGFKNLWGVEFALAAAVVMLVAAGSLTPFSLDLSSVRSHLGRLTWVPSTRADSTSNFLVYLPVGFFLALWLRKLCGQLAALLLAAVGGFSLSFTCESLQGGLVGRYASWTDLIVNATAALTGAVVAVTCHGVILKPVRAWHATLHRRPVEALSAATVYAILLYVILPFGFVTTTDGLHRAFRESHLPVYAAIHAGRLVPQGPPPAPAAAERSTRRDVFLDAAFLLLGWLMAMVHRATGRRLRVALTGGIGQGWLLAVVVGTLEVFCIGQAFDLPALLARGMLASAGAGLAAVSMHWFARPDAAGPDITAVSMATLAGGLLLLFVANRVSDGSPLSVDMRWTPFEDYFRMSFGAAVRSIARLVGTHALLTFTLIAMADRIFGGRRVVVDAGTALLLCGVSWLVMSTRGRMSMSEVILVAATVGLSVIVHRAAQMTVPVAHRVGADRQA